MTYLLAHWILIVFEFGGIAMLIALLTKTSKLQGQSVSVDLARLRSGFKWMIGFVILATVSLTRLLLWQLGEAGLIAQFVVNLLTGVAFVLALLQLHKALPNTGNTETQNNTSEHIP